MGKSWFSRFILDFFLDKMSLKYNLCNELEKHKLTQFCYMRPNPSESRKRATQCWHERMRPKLNRLWRDHLLHRSYWTDRLWVFFVANLVVTVKPQMWEYFLGELGGCISLLISHLMSNQELKTDAFPYSSSWALLLISHMHGGGMCYVGSPGGNYWEWHPKFVTSSLTGINKFTACVVS